MRSRLIILSMAVVIILSACGKAQPTWQEQYDLGIRYLSEGNYEEAIIAFTAAIEIDPKQAEPYVGRGDAYVGSGETEENLTAAKEDYERAIELDETNADAYLGLADVYIRQGEYNKALEILKQGLEKVGENQEISDKINEIDTGNISDSSGKTRRMTNYDAADVVQWYHDYTYNAQGQQDSVTSFDSVGNQTGHVDITYDKIGNELISYWYMGTTGEVGREERNYNNGLLANSIFYNLDGTLESTLTYTYNSIGQMIRSDSIYHPNETCTYRLYEYDDHGNQIKESLYGKDGELRSYSIFTYDENDRRTGYQDYYGNGELNWYEVYHYDEQGKYISCEKYNEAGNLIESTSYN